MTSVFAQAAATPALPPDLVLPFVLLDLVIIFAVARSVGAFFRRFGQPMVVGEILAGVLLGPTLLGATVFQWGNAPRFLRCDLSLGSTEEPSITSCIFPPQSRSMLGVIGQIALIFFMFLVGLEFDFTTIKGRARGIISVSLSVIVAPLALGFAIAPLLYNSKFVGGFGTPDQASRTSFALMVGAMLAVTAFPVMARILQEKQLTQSVMGSTGVAAAAVVTVLMFLTVAVAAGVARDASAGSMAMRFLGTGIYLAVLFLAVRPALAPLGRAYQQRGSMSPELFAALLVIAFASAFVADRIGINVIVGAFLAGIVVPAPRKQLFLEVSSRLSEFTTIALLPVFLAFSGLNTDFTKLGASFVAGIALFLVAGVAGKWIGGAVGARVAGLTWAEGNVLGILMNCRGLLVLVAALLAMNSGVITGQLQVGAVLMALITTAMTGPLFDAFLPRISSAGSAMPPAVPESA
jgi:Kef-type K+ transport system membrane component KefB